MVTKRPAESTSPEPCGSPVRNARPDREGYFRDDSSPTAECWSYLSGKRGKTPLAVRPGRDHRLDDAGNERSGLVPLDALSQSHATSTVGVVLSGMGRDGAQGLLELRQAGGLTLSQSSASAGVSAMPKAAEDLGAVCESYSAASLIARLDRLFPRPRP